MPLTRRSQRRLEPRKGTGNSSLGSHSHSSTPLLWCPETKCISLSQGCKKSFEEVVIITCSYNILHAIQFQNSFISLSNVSFHILFH